MQERCKTVLRRGMLLLALGAVLWVLVRCEVPCLFRRLTGVICPSCGMSRAWLAVLRAELREAFSYHPMFWSVPVFAVFFLFREKASTRAGKAVFFTLLIAYLACYLLRLLGHPGGAAALHAGEIRDLIIF